MEPSSWTSHRTLVAACGAPTFCSPALSAASQCSASTRSVSGSASAGGAAGQKTSKRGIRHSPARADYSSATIRNSVRRFCAFPRTVLLVAIGFRGPKPTASSLEGEMPFATR